MSINKYLVTQTQYSPFNETTFYFDDDISFNKSNELTLSNYKINPLFSKLLPILQNYKIIILADTAVTLNNVMKTGKSRWYEVVKFMEATSDICNIINSNMLDIYLSNHPLPINISTRMDFKLAIGRISRLSNDPNSISSRLRDILNISYNNYSGRIIVILTDGELINTYLKEYRSIQRILTDSTQHTDYITFISCTDDQKCIQVLNDLSSQFPHVNVINSYMNECNMANIRVQENLNPTNINTTLSTIGTEFNYGDYVIYTLIGHIIMKLPSTLNFKSSFYDYSQIVLDISEIISSKEESENNTLLYSEVLTTISNNSTPSKKTKRKGQCVIL